MALADPAPSRDEVLRCAYCGAVIGVYEPATQLVGDIAMTTSRAADPSLSAESPGLLYHSVCYALSRRESGR
jgi:hypothetical protein